MSWSGSGGPTDLPWGLEIDERHAAARGYSGVETFHPTFLYESLWNLGLVLLLIWIDKTKKLRAGALLAVYALGYLTVRLWLETVRVDHATEIAGVRVNIWMSIIGIAIAGGWLLLCGRRPEAEREAEVEIASEVSEAAECRDAEGQQVEH